MTRRIVAITVAIVLAALGTIGGVFLILTADSRAQSAINDAVTVAVATKRISSGTSGADVRAGNMVRFEKMPRTSVPSDAMSEITAEFDKLVTTSSIAPGQLLLEANFGSESETTSGLVLPEGKMAVTVQTGSPEQVAGFIHSGSQVTIFLTYDVVDSKGRSTNIEKTRVLLPRVEVLAVGAYTGEASDSASQRSQTNSLLVTVAVTLTEAERLIEGLSHGTLYLGLLTGSIKVEPGGGVDNTDDTKPATPLFP